MNADEIRNVMKLRPFKPFTLHTTRGGSILVPHPDYVLFPSPRVQTTTFVVYDQENRFHMLDINQVAELREHRS